MTKPWLNEPDHLEFRYKGYPCIIHRVQMHGALCGYVGIPKTHPFHKKGYGEIDVSVHGGLTYSEVRHGPICHKPAESESDEIWWIGFDCVHWLDIAPKLEELERGILGDRFMDLDLIFRNIKEPIKQLASLKTKLESL